MCYDNYQKALDSLTIKRGNLLEIKPLKAIEAINEGKEPGETGSLNN